MKEFKIKSPVICPKCGEKYSFYISKKKKRKGILPGEYEHESLFEPHYRCCYDCFTCGYHWNIRKSEISLLVKIFPFLRDN